MQTWPFAPNRVHCCSSALAPLLQIEYTTVNLPLALPLNCHAFSRCRILTALLTDLMRSSASRSHPKLLLRRTESVAEKLLGNWLCFLLFPFILVCSPPCLHGAHCRGPQLAPQIYIHTIKHTYMYTHAHNKTHTHVHTCTQ